MKFSTAFSQITLNEFGLLSTGDQMHTFLFFLACTNSKNSVIIDEGSLDSDGDGIPAEEDCDEMNAEVYPDAEELCDGIDNNCDGQVDEGVTTDFFADADGDGYGDPETATSACRPPRAMSAKAAIVMTGRRHPSCCRGAV